MFETATARALRGLSILLILGLVAGVLAIHVLDGSTEARRALLEREHLHLRARVHDLARDNAREAAELSRLEMGVEGWRDVARRDLGMVREGEVVYRFPGPNGGSPGRPPASH